MNLLVIAIAIYTISLVLLFIRVINGSCISAIILTAMIITPPAIIYMEQHISEKYEIQTQGVYNEE